MSFSRSQRSMSLGGPLSRSVATPEPGGSRPLLNPTLVAIPRGSTPDPRGSPKCRQLRSTSPQARGEPELSPSKSASRMRLPSNVLEAKRRRAAERTICDVGTFGFRNPYVRIVGETRNGAPCGYGVMYLSDGGSVEGTFDASAEMTCADGCRRWADGSTYTGPLLKGEAHGAEGVYFGVDGTEYRGSFAFGQRSGQGVLCNRGAGVQYSGEFQRGLFHGRGELLRPGLHAVGNFERGKPHGYAVLQYDNGDRWEGPCADGLPHTAAASADEENAVEDENRTRGAFASVLTGVTYTGPMVEGSRPMVPNTIIASDVLVAGSPHPPSLTAGSKRKPGFAKAVAAAADQAGLSSVARRLTPSTRAGSLSASKRLPRKSGVAMDGPPPALPRYVGQLATDKLVTVPFGKPLVVKVTLGRRVLRQPTLASTVRKATGKSQLIEPSVTDTTLPHETGRTVRVQVFPLPTNQGPGFPGSGMRQLADYHERVAPAPVPMYSAGDGSLSLLSGTVSPGSPHSPQSPVAPTLTPSPTPAGKLAKAGSKLPPVTKAASSGQFSKGRGGDSVSGASASPPAPQRPTLLELAVTTEAGLAEFPLRLADPGSYYLRFDVPPDVRGLQRTPGADSLPAEDREALAVAVGYVPIRLIRQC